MVPVAAWALDRIFAFIATIKDSRGITVAISMDLRSSGAEQNAPELATIQPVFSVTLMGDHAHLG